MGAAQEATAKRKWSRIFLIRKFLPKQICVRWCVAAAPRPTVNFSSPPEKVLRRDCWEFRTGVDWTVSRTSGSPTLLQDVASPSLARQCGKVIWKIFPCPKRKRLGWNVSHKVPHRNYDWALNLFTTNMLVIWLILCCGQEFHFFFLRNQHSSNRAQFRVKVSVCFRGLGQLKLNWAS